MKQFLRNKSAMTGSILIGILVITAVFADAIAPKDPYKMDIWESFRPPEGLQGEYILGTDDMGRDLLSRIIVGSRISLLVAAVYWVSLVFGVTLGAIAGYRRVTDAIIMRFMDLILAFLSSPGHCHCSLVGPGVANAMLAIAIVGFLRW